MERPTEHYKKKKNTRKNSESFQRKRNYRVQNNKQLTDIRCIKNNIGYKNKVVHFLTY